MLNEEPHPTGIDWKDEALFFLQVNLFLSNTPPSNFQLSTLNFQLSGGGLLYKTFFSGSKNIRNKTNVNPLFRPQKGTFSPFLSVSSNYDRPLCHYDRANV